MNFIEKNVSVEKAVIILSKNGIQVNEKEAKIILELLYLVSKNYDKPREKKNTISLTGLRTIVQLRLNL
ncbi:PTS sugar transporter subunit IIBC [Flavobacterium pectinovorum]|uniref:PTS sugar transporter subunit IIBC n=1 Tax=Flavobacterium pectinovorum TaxID=29533 RepID=A0A502EE98_9FLAO|nr:PTS sugar transporter subunit IIBC [Flavobacterium pectinovorum]TPG34826.1 PTS sugar transporter subunit IIBC [Flavobacterium pectinovorum]